MNCLAQIQKHFMDILLYSGRGPLKIGPYSNCLEKQGMDYKLLNFYLNAAPSTPLYEGICLPESCKGQQLQIILNQIIKRENLPVTLLSIQENIPDQVYEYNLGFFIFLIIMSIFIVLVLVSSCSKTLMSHPTLSVFSLHNSMKIFKYHHNNLNVLNGVKSLSMLWVIFGHQYSMIIASTSNTMTIQNQTSKWFYLLVEAGIWAVDTFFFVGGFLVAYAVLKQKSDVFAKYPLSILNRFLRFIPSYFIAILIFYSVMIHLSSGPLWSANIPGIQNCSRMWKPLLFVDNLVDNGGTMCMGWGWYLQNDMQIFIYCMLVLAVYKLSKNSAYLMIYLSIVASWAYNMQQTYDYKYHNMSHISDLDQYQDYMLNIYIKPWARCPPYLYGLLLGILYIQYLNEEEGNFLRKLYLLFSRKAWVRRSVELFGVVLGLFLVLIARTNQAKDVNWSQLSHSLYLTYPKTLFVVAVSFIILPTLLGINSFIKSILDTKFFNFIGKISFWTYLIHLIVMTVFISSINTDYYLSPIPNYPLFVAISVLSMIFGFVFMVIIEIPCMKIQKKLMGSLLGMFEKKKVKRMEQIEGNDAEKKEDDKKEEENLKLKSESDDKIQ